MTAIPIYGYGKPPSWATWIDDQNITALVHQKRYPIREGTKLIAVTGIRAQESLQRLSRIASTGGALTKNPTAPDGSYVLAPIYDWSDSDVWKFIKDFGVDYNQAYNDLFRIGVPRRLQRIAPPTMKEGVHQLKFLYRLYPHWFNEFDKRVPGVRMAALYGKNAYQPIRYIGESWSDVFERGLKAAEAAGVTWLVERMLEGRTIILREHKSHSDSELPELARNLCKNCLPRLPGSWQGFTKAIWNGDPYAGKIQRLAFLEPETIRAGAGKWFEDNQKGALYW